MDINSILDYLDKKDYDAVFRRLNEMPIETFLEIVSQINPKKYPILPAISVFRGCNIFHDLTKLFSTSHDDFIQEYGIYSNLLDSNKYVANYAPTIEKQRIFDQIVYGLSLLEINLCLYPCNKKHVFQQFYGIYNYKGFTALVQKEEKYHMYLGNTQLTTEFIGNHIDDLNNALQYMNSFGLYTSAESIRIITTGFQITDAMLVTSQSDIPKQWEDAKYLIRNTHKHDCSNKHYHKVVEMVGT